MFITFVGLQDNFELYLTTYLSLHSYFERRKMEVGSIVFVPWRLRKHGLLLNYKPSNSYLLDIFCGTATTFIVLLQSFFVVRNTIQKKECSYEETLFLKL